MQHPYCDIVKLNEWSTWVLYANLVVGKDTESSTHYDIKTSSLLKYGSCTGTYKESTLQL